MKNLLTPAKFDIKVLCDVKTHDATSASKRTWIRTLQAGEWVIVTIRLIVLFLPVQSGLEKKFEFHSSSSNVKFILQLHLPLSNRYIAKLYSH